MMKNKMQFTSSFVPFDRRILLFLLPVLMAFYGCVPEPIKLDLSHHESKKEINIVVVNRTNMKPVKGINVHVTVNRSYSWNELSDSNGRTHFVLPYTDTSFMEVEIYQKGWEWFEDYNQMRTLYNSEYVVQINPMAYLRCHVTNEAPVSTSEKIKISTPEEYIYVGSTDRFFIAEMYESKSDLDCITYWNNATDSAFKIPIKLTAGDTTDLAITF